MTRRANGCWTPSQTSWQSVTWWPPTVCSTRRIAPTSRGAAACATASDTGTSAPPTGDRGRSRRGESRGCIRRVTADLTLALAVDRAIRRRAALAATELPGGLVVRHPELHDVHYLNAVLVDAGTPELDGVQVAALAERWLGDLGHRHVVLDDAAAGERAAE